MFSLFSQMLPIMAVQMETQEIIALWATPVVLVLLYLLVRMDANQRSGEMRTTLGRLDDRQAHLEQQMDRLVDVLEKIRLTSEQNNKNLVAALEEMAYTEVEQTENEVQATAAPAAKTASVPAPKPTEVKSTATPTSPAAPAPATEVTPAVSGDPLARGLALLADIEGDHPANLLAARDAFKQAVAGPDAAPAYNGLSETLFWLGELSSSTKEKEHYHEEGVAHGKEAVARLPGEASAHLWYAANMGAHGMARGIMSSLFYLGDIDKHGSKAIELDERFFHAAPLRLMGRFYHQCPGWPIGKGDTAKAVSMLERAVELGPHFMMNYLYLAEAYLAKRKKAEAKKVLENMLAVTDFALMPNYMRSIQEDGRKLLRKC